MAKRIIFQIIALLFLAGTALGAATTPQVDLGSMCGEAGTVVTLPIKLTNIAGTTVAAVGMDIGYATDILESPTCTVGQAGSAAGKDVSCSTPSAGILRIGIFGLNNAAIGNGVVANVSLTIKAAAPTGITQLTNTPSASDPNGDSVGVNGSNGAVIVTGQIFNDCPMGQTFFCNISALYLNNVTTGCTQTPLNYCPSNNVTRQAMAAFIIRAKFGENFTHPTTPYFTDVPSSHQFFKYIQKMRELNITTGCTATQYCPSNSVTRAAMAAFIIRAAEGEPANDYCSTGSPFTDVSTTNQFCMYIKRLYERGITTGCTATQYCPQNNVTRAAMAAFLTRAFLGMQ
jgi:hypothetical protein